MHPVKTAPSVEPSSVLKPHFEAVALSLRTGVQNTPAHEEDIAQKIFRTQI
jgi:hypothetical protein